MCGMQEIIKSENDNDQNININMAIVSSIVNTGQGYSQLEEYSATMNMPNMSNKLYQNYHYSIYKHLNELALNEMLLAGKEEAKLALEKGEVDHLGRPKIAVVADGAWSKRSYKTKYNALSGVVSTVLFNSYFTIYKFNLYKMHYIRLIGYMYYRGENKKSFILWCEK